VLCWEEGTQSIATEPHRIRGPYDFTRLETVTNDGTLRLLGFLILGEVGNALEQMYSCCRSAITRKESGIKRINV